MRADISVDDEALQGAPISRAEAFGSSSASSEQSEDEASSIEGEGRENASESGDESNEEGISEAETDPRYSISTAKPGEGLYGLLPS